MQCKLTRGNCTPRAEQAETNPDRSTVNAHKAAHLLMITPNQDEDFIRSFKKCHLCQTHRELQYICSCNSYPMPVYTPGAK